MLFASGADGLFDVGGLRLVIQSECFVVLNHGALQLLIGRHQRIHNRRNKRLSRYYAKSCHNSRDGYQTLIVVFCYTLKTWPTIHQPTQTTRKTGTTFMRFLAVFVSFGCLTPIRSTKRRCKLSLSYAKANGSSGEPHGSMSVAV